MGYSFYTTIHEAGHAVAAVVLGGELDEIQIFDPPGGGPNGMNGQLLWYDTGNIEDQMSVTAAGPLAEKHFRGSSPSWDDAWYDWSHHRADRKRSGDFTKFMRLTDERVNEMISEQRLSGLAEQVASANYPGEIRERCIEQAQRIVTRYAKHIERIADALEAKRRLSGAEVRKLMSGQGVY